MRRGEAAAWQAVFESVAAEGKWIGAELPVPDRTATLEDTWVDQPDAAMFVAEVDGAIVGWLNARQGEDGFVELGMGLVDGHRGRGLGSALLEVLIAWARDIAAPGVRLQVFPHNERAIALYRKFGFVDVARNEKAWPRRTGEVWDSITMELPFPYRQAP